MSALRSRDKSAGSGFERCAATARRVAGRTPAINCQASNKKNPVPEGAGFFAVWRLSPRWRCAYRGYKNRSPGKAHRAAPGESRCHTNVNERLSRKTFCLLRPDAPPGPRWRYAYRGYKNRSPGKAHRAAPGESRCHTNVNERLSRKTFCLLRPDAPPGPRWRYAYRGYKNRSPGKATISI